MKLCKVTKSSETCVCKNEEEPDSTHLYHDIAAFITVYCIHKLINEDFGVLDHLQQEKGAHFLNNKSFHSVNFGSKIIPCNPSCTTERQS